MAVRLQVPAPTSVALVPLTVHTLGVVEVKTTALPPARVLEVVSVSGTAVSVNDSEAAEFANAIVCTILVMLNVATACPAAY